MQQAAAPRWIHAPPSLSPAARRAVLVLVATAAAAGDAALVSVSPALALVLGGAAVVAGILTNLARIPVAVIVVGGALTVAAIVDLPRRFTVGPTTSYAEITAALASVIGLVGVSRYVLGAVRGTGRLLWPLYAYAVWAILSMVWFKPSFDGIQNTLVFVAFAALIPVTAATVIRGDLSIETARRAVTCAILFASCLEVGNLVTGGLNGEAVIGPRSYALVGVVGVAWGVGHARFGNRRIGLLAPLCWLLITLSLSRLAFAASLLIIVIGSLDVRTAGRLVRSVLVIGTVAGLAYFSVTSFGPLASRFRPQGDLKSVGGVSVDVTGRTNLWHVTWVSYLRSPIIGQGAGSAETVIDRSRGSAHGQPHDDYIRVLHDYGIIGLVLLLAALAALLTYAGRATRSTRRGDPAAPIHLAAALAVIGLLAAMATDNAIVYPFVVVPIAVILGLSIGVRRRAAWR